MNTIIKNTLLVGAAAFGLVSCSENSWNDQLDGFEGGPQFSDVRTFDYTLTADDYTNLAANSTNVAKAKEAGLSNELKAVGTLGYLNQQIQPADYIPPFLKDPDFKYFTLTEGSAINITYKIADNLPEKMIALNAADQYTVSTEDYQQVYGSDTDYTAAFSPSNPASKFLPGILDNALPTEEGDYAVVTYNVAATDPVFGNTPDVPAFEETSVLGSVKVGDNVSAAGVVTGVCNQGFILTDKAASILVYYGKEYDNSYALGNQVKVEGPVGAYNTGLQIDGTKAEVSVAGQASSVTYPAPAVYDGAAVDAAITRTEDSSPIYCQVTGVCAVSGNYYNLNIPGTTTATGSFYQLTDAQKAQLADGQTYTITGYFISVSKSGGNPKFFNILPVDIKASSASAKPRRQGPRRVVTLASTTECAVYTVTGGTWKTVSDVDVLQPSDYTEMGSRYGNLQGTQPAEYLPTYLAKKYPFAQADAVHYVLYKYYNGSSTSLRSMEYTFNGTAWEPSITDEGVVTETQQFVYKKNGWVMDPSIELTLPAGRNQATSAWFFQACVDWIKANVPDGANYITSYGNNEYYCGTSAYQGNIDLRPSAAKAQYAAGYEGMTDDQIVALEKKRFESEVCPGTLSVLYPNIMPVPGVDVTVTINFSAYDGNGTTQYQIIYKVTGKAQFEFVSCTWND